MYFSRSLLGHALPSCGCVMPHEFSRKNSCTGRNIAPGNTQLHKENEKFLKPLPPLPAPSSEGWDQDHGKRRSNFVAVRGCYGLQLFTARSPASRNLCLHFSSNDASQSCQPAAGWEAAAGRVGDSPWHNHIPAAWGDTPRPQQGQHSPFPAPTPSLWFSRPGERKWTHRLYRLCVILG